MTPCSWPLDLACRQPGTERFGRHDVLCPEHYTAWRTVMQTLMERADLLGGAIGRAAYTAAVSGSDYAG